ncbi:lysyl oxidase family protein [Haloferula sp. BvORR071]|uniref:lysyl oxidase family protein n=1 Tax=Haloferula sp. BvORR071 TaxID=1396141 RepID=UPI0005509F9A|nr:lysyl oxidase family protein [Haloferula sp. BvORR071]
MKAAFALMLGLSAVLPLQAHYEVTPFPKVVQTGVPIVGLIASDPHALVVYRVEVPAGAERLLVTTSGGTGNIDVFVRKGAHPTYNGAQTDYSSRYPGTRQQVRIPTPEPGVWYVGLQADGGYFGVQLLVQTPVAKGALVQPSFDPPPGIYPGSVTCKIKSRTKKSVTRFTTDGNDPDSGSPLIPGSVTLTGDTTLKARSYGQTGPNAGQEGPVAEAFYQVRPPGDVIDLVNTKTISHLASGKGGRHLFRVTVEAGQRLAVQSEGGKGKSALAVLFGQAPPTGKPVKGEPTVRGASRVVIPETQAGDYYIALDATGAFSGRSLMAAVAGDGPDLMPWAEALRPYVSVEEFDPLSCEVQEGLIGEGQRRLLRYSTEVRNIGSLDMVMPDPHDNPFFEYHACHGHYHFKGFASSRLLDMNDNEVRTGRKVSFCLLDSIRWERGAKTARKYNCGSQGIQAGWGDVYDSGLPGQWIEIGDLPAGDYQLEVIVNPDSILSESNYDNNVVRIPVTIPEE